MSEENRVVINYPGEVHHRGLPQNKDAPERWSNRSEASTTIGGKDGGFY